MVSTEFNKISIRACILDQVKQGKEIEKVYKHMCKLIGTGFIEYPDFDYWYYRFYHGDHDLHHDRSLDPKTRGFSDLPSDILEEIMDYSELNEKFVLRKVCHRLRDIFDNNSFCYDSVGIAQVYCHTEFHVNNVGGTYEKWNNSCDIRNSERLRSTSPMGPGKKFKGNDPIKMAIDDMMVLLKNPKLRLTYLCVTSDDEDKRYYKKKPVKKMLNFLEISLKALPHKIHARGVSGRIRTILSVLPYVEPGTLQSIYLDFSDENDAPLLHKVSKLDQWKQVKELVMLYPQFIAPIECFAHFTHVELTLIASYTESLIPIKQLIHNFPNLETCKVNCSSMEVEAEDFWKTVELPNSVNSDNSNIRHRLIPNANEFLEVTYFPYSIRPWGKNGTVTTPAYVEILRKH